MFMNMIMVIFMRWILQQVTNKLELMHCSITGELIMYGDFYYQDIDNANTHIKANVFNRIREGKKREQFDYTEAVKAQNRLEYEEKLKEAEHQYLLENMLNQPILEKGEVKPNSLD